MKIVIAADPFALTLRDSIVAHLEAQGHEVMDVGAAEENELPYFDGAAAACKVIQAGEAERGILLCGTGMGMSIVANKHSGVTAACVESVYAAKMCRAVNNANVLTLGRMIWGDFMANEAVDAFLGTKLADGLEPFTEFLQMAEQKVADIDQANRKESVETAQQGGKG